MEMVLKLKNAKIEGEIIEAEVKPFGNSAHIPISKKYLGKPVKIIIPTKEFSYEDEWEKDSTDDSND